MRKVSRRGIALITVLTMCSILLMMTLALYASSRGGLLGSLNDHRQTAALYVAEAGLAQALEQLEHATPPLSTPATGRLSGTTPSGGTWEIGFNDAGPTWTDTDSVNNLTGSGASGSYRGAGTVPAGTAMLVVKANFQGTERVLEAIVVRGGMGLAVSNALQSGEEMSLAGSIKIDGVRALDDSTTVPGNVRSNSGAARAIVWDGSGIGSINGAVGAVGGIDLASLAPTGGLHPGSAVSSFPSINIPATIASKATTSLTPVLNPTGPNYLPAGDYYLSGDVTLDGDLSLDGANLYIDGNATFTGTVSGQGSLYVSGATTVRGEAALDADPDRKVALVSQGDITLAGYGPEAFIADLATRDGRVATWWTEAKNSAGTLKNLVETRSMADIQSGGADYTTYDAQLMKLGRLPGVSIPAGDPHVLQELANRIAAEPASKTRDFLVNRLNWMADFYSYGRLKPGDDAQVLSDYAASGGRDVRGFLDAVIDQNRGDLVSATKNLLRTIDPDNLGAAQFQGLVYTQGNLTVTGDLSVRGAVIARKKITLQAGSSITYVEDYFDDPNGFGGNAGTNLSAETWFGR